MVCTTTLDFGHVQWWNDGIQWETILPTIFKGEWDVDVSAYIMVEDYKRQVVKRNDDNDGRMETENDDR